jgi:hypothetical protein
MPRSVRSWYPVNFRLRKASTAMASSAAPAGSRSLRIEGSGQVVRNFYRYLHAFSLADCRHVQPTSNTITVRLPLQSMSSSAIAYALKLATNSRHRSRQSLMVGKKTWGGEKNPYSCKLPFYQT